MHACNPGAGESETRGLLTCWPACLAYLENSGQWETKKNEVDSAWITTKIVLCVPHTCAHTQHTHTFTHTYTHTLAYEQVHTHSTRACTHICTHACTHTLTHASMPAHTHRAIGRAFQSLSTSLAVKTLEGRMEKLPGWKAVTDTSLKRRPEIMRIVEHVIRKISRSA